MSTAGPERISDGDTAFMTNHISIQIDNDDQYERLQQVREEYGVTWKGLLIQGMFHLEGQDTSVKENDNR